MSELSLCWDCAMARWAGMCPQATAVGIDECGVFEERAKPPGPPRVPSIELSHRLWANTPEHLRPKHRTPLGDEIDSLRQQLETMMAERDTLNEACKVLIDDRDWFRTRLEEAQQQLADLRQQLATVTAERDATQAQVTRLREALEDVIRAEVALANLGFYRSHEDGKSYRIARAALRESEQAKE